MNATERARRSDAYYHENSTRRAFCDRIAMLESELDDARRRIKELEEGKGNGRDDSGEA